MMLLKLIYKVSVGLKRGKIVVYMDRRHLIKDMSFRGKKSSQYAKDCGAIKSRFDEIQEKLEISIIVKYSSKEIKSLE